MLRLNSEGNQLSQAFSDALGNPTVRYDVRLVSDGLVIDCDIARLTLTLGAGANAGSSYADLEIGAAYTTTLEAEVFLPVDMWITRELDVHVGLEVSEDAFEYVPVARVYVTECEKNRETALVSAVGAAGAKLSPPIGLSTGQHAVSAILNAATVASGIRCELESRLSGYASMLVATSSNDSCRDAVAKVALALGGFACEEMVHGNGFSPVVLVCKCQPDATVDVPDDYVTEMPKVAEDEYVVDGVKVDLGDRAVTYGTGRYVVDGRELTADNASAIWANMRGYAFYPGEVTSALIDPRITPRDAVRAAANGARVSVSSRGVYATFDGGYFGKYSSTGLTEIQRDSLKSPLAERVDVAEEAAREAATAAKVTSAHFWHDENGAHVTEDEQDDYLAAEAGGFPTWQPDRSQPNYKPWFALLLNQMGQLFKTGARILSAFTHSAVSFYDGDWDGTGDGAEHVVAAYGKNGYQVGRKGESHQVGDYHSLKMVDKEGYEYVHFSDLRDRSGVTQAFAKYTGDGERKIFPFDSIYPISTDYVVKIDGSEVTQGVTKTTNNFRFATAPRIGSVVSAEYTTDSWWMKAFTLGTRNSEETVGALSLTVGQGLSAGRCSLAVGDGGTKAPGSESMAVGLNCQANGAYSSAIGTGAMANGFCSHAGGFHTVASGSGSFAFGSSTVSPGDGGAAFGTQCSAHGTNAFAAGYQSTAEGMDSISLGNGFVAKGEASVAMGKNSQTGVDAIGSIAVGEGLRCYGTRSAVFGKWNEGNGTAAPLVIGNGVDDSNRRNVFRVGWDGAVWTANPAGTRSNLGLGALATKDSLAESDVPSLPASKIGSGTLAVARGGTGQSGDQVTTTASSIITAASGFTIVSAVAHKWGPVCQLSVVFKRSTDIAANGLVTVGTIASAFRPANTSFVGSNRFIGNALNGGSLQVRNMQGSTATAGTEYTVAGTYFL